MNKVLENIEKSKTKDLPQNVFFWKKKKAKVERKVFPAPVISETFT